MFHFCCKDSSSCKLRNYMHFPFFNTDLPVSHFQGSFCKISMNKYLTYDIVQLAVLSNRHFGKGFYGRLRHCKSRQLHALYLVRFFFFGKLSPIYPKLLNFLLIYMTQDSKREQFRFITPSFEQIS